LDGRAVGHTPLAVPLRLPVGTTVVEIRAIGFFPTTRSVSISAGLLTRETITLSPSTTMSPSEGVGSTDSKSNSTAERWDRTTESAGGEGGVTFRQDPLRTWRRPVGFSLAAGAAALAVGGGVVLLLRNGKASAYNRLVDSTGCGAESRAMCDQLRADGDLYGTWAVIGFSAAVVLAATSAILFLTEPSPASGLSMVDRPCRIGWTPHGVSCSIVF